MKYFTKEWYKLMQNIHYTEGFEPIDEENSTEQGIKRLYAERLAEWIQDEKEIYDARSDYSDLYDALESKEFNPIEWLFVDENKKQVVEPATNQEVIEHLKIEEKQAMKEYNKRKPFDEKQSAREFNKFYKTALSINNMLPKWVYDKVDKRLIALGYLPQCVYDKLKQQEMVNKQEYDNREKQAIDTLYNQDIDEEIYANFNFHDDILKSIKDIDGNCIMKIKHSDFIESYIVTVLFKNATIIEMEEVKFGKSIYLYEEIYKINDGYEVHMMLECDGLKYITIKCSDIEFK